MRIGRWHVDIFPVGWFLISLSTLVVLALIVTGTFVVTGTFAEVSLSGRWDLMMDPDFKGNPSTEHCQMNQLNRKLTVTCGATGAAMAGEVHGQNVAWKFISPGRWTAAWIGKFDKPAANIKGTWQFTYSDGDKMRGNFTAQKRPH
jgi:hypothetical protein